MEQRVVSKGNLLGGILLIAGSCIGAGMLGLPVLSAQAGFFPSIVVFFACWLFMLATGLLLLEVNLWFGGGTSIITMTEKTLGPVGKGIAWFVFLFLFESLMVAYVAASGALLSDFTSLPPNLAAICVTLLFGFLIYLGIGAVDWFNRLMMAGLVISYFALVFVGLPHVDRALLQRSDFSAAPLVIPVVIVSFGFHNLIPSLTTYFKDHTSTLIKALIWGSLIPLCIYILWQWLILGMVPLSTFATALNKGEIATEALRDAAGSSWIVDAAQSFSFFAIITSFIGVALSFVDFIADGLNITKRPLNLLFLIALVLLPPMVFAMIHQDIFLVALKYAGGYGAVTLFGILPPLMVWRGRYVQGFQGPRLLPGDKVSLGLVLACALLIITLQIVT